MDFGSVLNAAQKNEKVGKKPSEIRCYSTKFEPPKKEQRNKQQLSENIKKFLAKKEAEEKMKQRETHHKREQLLAMRAKDKKATRTMNVMLKRTKSASQSVLKDAINDVAPESSQPDEDDYGYVSQEASAFYKKMMEKYSKLPEDSKFGNSTKKKVSSNLASTKDRVRAALEREKEEANMPHRRRRKHEDEHEEKEAVLEEKPMKSKPKLAPPPINFNDLLKLAEKKQFEPIVIENKPKDEEKPLTKKQKKEIERQREWKERKEGKLPPLETTIKDSKPHQKILEKITPKIDKTTEKINNSKEMLPKKQLHMSNSNEKQSDKKNPKVASSRSSNSMISNGNSNMNSISKDSRSTTLKKLPPKPLPNKMNRENVPVKSTPSKSSALVEVSKQQQERIKQLEMELAKARKLASQEKYVPEPKSKPIIKTQKTGSSAPSGPRYLPPMKKPKLQVNKGRLLDEDDEEYDSEMDDFIDDGPEESEDYSKYISEIFGYDKSKYKNLDDDIDNMESTFAQQMREEVISTKIGIKEDLEDMRLEEEEKRRKALKKKQMRS